MRRYTALLGIGALMFLAPMAYADMVIDPLDDETPYAMIENQADVTAYSWDTADSAPGSPASLRMEYTDAGNGWGQVQGQYTIVKDLSAETTIRFWAKGSVDGMRMNLCFAVPDWNDGASWVEAIGPMTTSWAQYEVPMADFVVNPYYADGVTPVDWTNVGTFQLAPTWGTFGTLWVDQLEAFGSTGIGVTQVLPSKGSAVPSLPDISVTFSKSVTGVTPDDLTVNGSPATNVTGDGMGPYVFTGFAPPALGTANVVLASGGITDGVDTFPGDSWTYLIEEWMRAVAPMATEPVTLDGILTPGEWDDANHYYFDGTDNNTRPGWAMDGEIPADDWSCTFSVKHDADFVYVAAYVYDDTLVTDGPDTPDWRDDRMEIYFDTDNSDSTNITNSPAGFQMPYDARNYAGGAGFQEWWWARASSDTVHVMTYEFQVAKDLSSTVTMVTGGAYGFDLSPCDADTAGDVRDNQIWWNAKQGSAWNNEPPWGEIFLAPGIPEAPQNLTGRGGDENALLEWEPVAFAEEYRIYQTETSGTYPTLPVTTSTLPRKTVTDLTNFTTYYFVVTAANTTGEGPPSNEVEVTPRGESLRARNWRLYR